MSNCDTVPISTPVYLGLGIKTKISNLAKLTNFSDEAKIAFSTLSDRFSGLAHPRIRLGVTGLSQAGKTVFITALVHNLLNGGRLPLFQLQREGRLISTKLEHQPDDTVPRFEYEKHLETLIKDRAWPTSTRSLSEIRLNITFQPKPAFGRYFSRGRLTIDLIDYPGEWLLDLSLLAKGYRQFSYESFERASSHLHRDLAAEWLGIAYHINIFEKADNALMEKLATSFKSYLSLAKNDARAFSMLPPGRFLMPGDLEGSPALTFVPLPNLGDADFPSDSLAAIMERRYESYKRRVVKPFFREHIARLDRQIILIDAMRAFNSGADAISDLQTTLGEILTCFRPGANPWWSRLWSHNINRLVIAATKADQLHHESHDRLEALAKMLVSGAMHNAGQQGAQIDCVALASIRATREAYVNEDHEALPVIVGTPLEGETIDGVVFDGLTETAIFPGDLPKDPRLILDQQNNIRTRFIRFRPPLIKQGAALPHIRFDRTLQFLFGDYLT